MTILSFLKGSDSIGMHYCKDIANDSCFRNNNIQIRRSFEEAGIRKKYIQICISKFFIFKRFSCPAGIILISKMQISQQSNRVVSLVYKSAFSPTHVMGLNGIF